MRKITISISFFMLLLSLPCVASDIPEELKQIISPQEELLAFVAADLNDDGLMDYVFVVESREAEVKSDEFDQGIRTLKIAIGCPDKSIKIVKISKNAVLCRTCGGSFDPFNLRELTASKKTFAVSHYGGTGERWSNTYQFNYSRRDDTWQLVYVEETTSDVSDHNKIITKNYRPPKSFGKIDISEFDPYNFIGVGKK